MALITAHVNARAIFGGDSVAIGIYSPSPPPPPPLLPVPNKPGLRFLRTLSTTFTYNSTEVSFGCKPQALVTTSFLQTLP